MYSVTYLSRLRRSVCGLQCFFGIEKKIEEADVATEKYPKTPFKVAMEKGNCWRAYGLLAAGVNLDRALLAAVKVCSHFSLMLATQYNELHINDMHERNKNKRQNR